MSDTGTPPDDNPFLPPAEAADPEELKDPEELDEVVTPGTTDDDDSGLSVTEPVEVLLQSFVTVFKPTPEIDLETIRERTTIRNVVDYRAIDQVLDPGWAVAPEIVKFGEEPLADALVFSHYERSYDVILKPDDIFTPTDEVELFIHDRTRGIRHRLVQTKPTLDDALEHTVLELTHSRFNPAAPYLASLIGDEVTGELDDDLQLTTE